MKTLDPATAQVWEVYRQIFDFTARQPTDRYFKLTGELSAFLALADRYLSPTQKAEILEQFRKNYFAQLAETTSRTDICLLKWGMGTELTICAKCLNFSHEIEASTAATIDTGVTAEAASTESTAPRPS